MSARHRRRWRRKAAELRARADYLDRRAFADAEDEQAALYALSQDRAAAADIGTGR